MTSFAERIVQRDGSLVVPSDATDCWWSTLALVAVSTAGRGASQRERLTTRARPDSQTAVGDGQDAGDGSPVGTLPERTQIRQDGADGRLRGDSRNEKA